MGEGNSISSTNKNTNFTINHTFSENDNLSNLPDGDYIFIYDNLFSIFNFIYSNITFDFSSITPIQIFLLIITFISYYKYYALYIPIKESFIQCFIILKISVKEIFSFLNKK